jgi:hypothetical protein
LAVIVDDNGAAVIEAGPEGMLPAIHGAAVIEAGPEGMLPAILSSNPVSNSVWRFRSACR